jgi:inosose dehydratase
MKKIRRRDFIRTAALGGLVTATWPARRRSAFPRGPAGKEARVPFSLGLASYSFREFSLEDAISMTKRLGLAKICLKSMHLPLESSDSEIAAVEEKVRKAGLDLYGCGVVYMTNAAEVEQAFHYAGAAKMRIIIGVPAPDLLELVNRKVRDTDICLAIHNHGPDDVLYPTPGSAYDRIKGLDARLGLCLDVGHTARAGVDPAEAAVKCADRLLDVHIKDVSAASKEGQTVEMGRGVVDIPKFVRALIKIDYRGTAAFEYEKDARDPLPGTAESVGYFRGVLATV